jgi:hypothetical protein
MHDDVNLPDPSKATMADGTEKNWTLANLPEDQEYQDDDNENNVKPKLVMAAIPKTVRLGGKTAHQSDL